MQEVVFTVSRDGQEIKAEAQGFQGKGCVDTINKLTKNLGETLDSGKTPEFYQESSQGVKVGG